MFRPLWLEFGGALFHVTTRGNERCDIFFSDMDDDRSVFPDILRRTCGRLKWICHAYCLTHSSQGQAKPFDNGIALYPKCFG
jgi:hypothetical protein